LWLSKNPNYTVHSGQAAMNFVAVWIKKMKDEDDISLFDVPQTCTACGWQGKSQDRDRVPDPRGQKI